MLQAISERPIHAKWLAHYTIDNTVMAGKTARVVIGQEERSHIAEAWVIGPFVLARGYLPLRNGSVAYDDIHKKPASLWHFGLGYVIVSDRGAM